MLVDRRESSQNPPTTIVSITLGSNDIQGKNYHLVVSLTCGEVE